MNFSLKPVDLLRNFVSFTGVDRAVFFILLSRIWALVSSPVTLVLTTSFLTRVEQGYYYTFSSILGAVVFLEFGLSTVLAQFVSHEMADLKWALYGTPEGGNRSLMRLASIAQLGSIWYSISAGITLIVMVPLGQWYFYANEQQEIVSWQIPWIVMVVASALNLALSPLLALLEGAGFVSRIAYYRLLQSVIGSFTLWTCLMLHMSLYSLPVMTIGLLCVASLALLRDWLNPLYYLLRMPTEGHRINYIREVLPVHFEIGVSWLSGYLCFFLCTPILFAQLGAVTAGQYGVSLSLCLTMSSIAQSWVSSRSPQMGKLIATKKFDELSSLFRINAVRSIAIQILGSISLMLCVYLLNAMSSQYASRLLDLRSFCILSTGWILGHGTAILSIYLRAYKRDPLCYQSLATGILLVAGCAFVTPFFGITGVVITQFIVQLLALCGAVITYNWLRRSWQS